eukprot:487157-Pleurochrysis_carterae.AAC.1
MERAQHVRLRDGSRSHRSICSSASICASCSVLCRSSVRSIDALGRVGEPRAAFVACAAAVSVHCALPSVAARSAGPCASIGGAVDARAGDSLASLSSASTCLLASLQSRATLARRALFRRERSSTSRLSR